MTGENGALPGESEAAAAENKRMKIALFGANGQVGRECLRSFKGRGWEVLPLMRQQIDFSDPQSVYDKTLQMRPDLLVNACAYTAVDKAEQEPELAQAVNADSVGALGRAAAELGVPIIHISTDYVFDGSAAEPYVEDSPLAPLGVYGATKLGGEELLQAATEQHLILRTSWVFSHHGGNFVKTMMRLGADRPELSVVNDQVGCPTYAGDIADVIAELIERYQSERTLPWGVYHCSNAGSCSWFEFAQVIFSEAKALGGLECVPLVHPIPSAEYPTPVTRPAYSVLSGNKLADLRGKSMPSWRQGLKQVLTEL